MELLEKRTNSHPALIPPPTSRYSLTAQECNDPPNLYEWSVEPENLIGLGKILSLRGAEYGARSGLRSFATERGRFPTCLDWIAKALDPVVVSQAAS